MNHTRDQPASIKETPCRYDLLEFLESQDMNKEKVSIFYLYF